jgi:hypothetical protein
MKYYKISIKTSFPEYGRISSSANGKNISNNEDYFAKIRKGEVLYNTPLFDYFVLESYDKNQYWEWNLFDVCDGIGDYPGNNNWFLSENFKILLENFKIAPQYHFYEARLLFQGKKYKYWIFQFPITPYQNINFLKSVFSFDNEKTSYGFKSEEEYLLFYRNEYKKSKRKLKTMKVCFIDNFDIAKTTNNDIIISETLKQAIEENGVSGFEFSELDYEVFVEKSGHLRPRI